ncbi:MAG: hypothetical protein CM15mP36_16470 [Flavobacteriales bacterium]|nr:MAG: hypothetical protein CM15mP36_16470 [Flavobacteriales bacterium]
MGRNQYNYERKKSNGPQNLYNPDFGQEGYEFKRVLEIRINHL